MSHKDEVKKVMEAMGLPPEDKEAILASWVGQEKGQINMLRDYHQGTQPIRVNQDMLEYMFLTTYPDFEDKLKELVDAGKFNPKINLILAEEEIGTGEKKNTPRVSADTRQITLHETFLAYLWCVSYSIYILYAEKVDHPKINKEVGFDKYPISEDEIERAYNLFDYGRSLIAHYSHWDRENLPNPETYLAERRNYIEQSNMCYTEAGKFILAHELAHLERHLHLLDKETPDSNYLVFEIEADKLAIEHVLKGVLKMGITATTGIVVGLVSMFYFSSATTGKRHPNAEDRLTHALEMMNLGDQATTWGMACVGLELWDKQFELHFDWLESPDSPKHQYYHIIEQIKARL